MNNEIGFFLNQEHARILWKTDHYILCNATLNIVKKAKLLLFINF